MKKTFLLILLATMFFVLSACDLLTESTTNATQGTTTTNISSSDLTSRTSSTTTQFTTTSVMTTTTMQTTTQTTTQATTTNNTGEVDPIYPTGYSLLQDELDYVGIPSIGDRKILVFAVDFSDYPSSSSNLTIENLDLALNGQDTEVDFESLNSFYLKSSYNQLDLTADIYGFYRASNPASYYEEEYEKLWAVDPETGDYLYDYDEVTFPESDIIYELLTYYDNEIDYSEYDTNNDGYIDGIYVIYTHPISYETGSELWWSYQTFYWYTDYNGDQDIHENLDGVEANYITWMSGDFFTDTADNIDARTIIHETGHMMGLDDYYDYYQFDTNLNSGGLGGVDMMDSAYGDHGPLSKILLGWITPIVIEGSTTIDFGSYEESGDVILLIDNWEGTIFDEYFLITFYTPTELYDDELFYYDSSGILIYHVSAEIGNGFNSDYYSTIFNNNNTDSKDKIVKIIEADMNGSLDGLLTGNSEETDLFSEENIFGVNVYPSYKWYNGENTNLKVIIEEINTLNAVIRFIFY